MLTKAVLSVLGKDRQGIVATVAATLYQAGANIDDIQQTILGDMFSMTMLLSIDESQTAFEQLQERLAADAETLHVQVVLQREDLFDYMYKV
jgi:ACT domain-containing protein